MTRREAAMDNFRQGYNCAQSVVLAFEDILPVDKEQLSKLARSSAANCWDSVYVMMFPCRKPARMSITENAPVWKSSGMLRK